MRLDRLTVPSELARYRCCKLGTIAAFCSGNLRHGVCSTSSRHAARCRADAELLEDGFSGAGIDNAKLA